jgi:alanyl-tRNA synthetase
VPASATERLYYSDSYLRDFEGAIVERADDSRRIYLDRTAFYPTSGGQQFDSGTINGIQVRDVVDEGDRIAHLLAGPLPDEPVVVGRVEWTRRFDHMQQHTGQHLLSAVLADLFGYQTVGVHFGRESSTLDLETNSLSQDQIDRAEERANEVVVENRPVVTSFEDAGSAVGLRKPSGRTGVLRVVTIENLDRSACGGTHVRATGEIGSISIGKSERVRKSLRMEFFCGFRALRQARADRKLLGQLAGQFSAAREDLPQLILSRAEALKESQSALGEVQQQFDLCRARELYREAAPDAAGIRRTIVRGSGARLEEMRGLAQAFATLPMAIFIGAVESPPAVVLAASQDTRVDAAEVLKGLLGSVGGRGGGSASLAQGVLPGHSQLETVLNSLRT